MAQQVTRSTTKKSPRGAPIPGRAGGLAVLNEYGKEYFAKLGRKGGRRTAELVAAGHSVLDKKTSNRK
jgi:hypothetical protein